MRERTVSDVMQKPRQHGRAFLILAERFRDIRDLPHHAPDDLIDSQRVRKPRMLCRMIHLKVAAQLMDAAQTLKFPRVETVPNHLQVDMDISVDRITEHFYFWRSFKHAITSCRQSRILRSAG